jgi:hypothetical protein
MLEWRERTCDHDVVVSLPSTAEKMLADCSSNDQMCVHAIPTCTCAWEHKRWKWPYNEAELT